MQPAPPTGTWAWPSAFQSLTLTCWFHQMGRRTKSYQKMLIHLSKTTEIPQIYAQQKMISIACLFSQMCVDIVTEMCTCRLIQSSHAVVFLFPKSLFKLLNLDLIYSVIYLWLRLKADENIANNIMLLAWLILVFSMGTYLFLQSKPWISYKDIRNWDESRLCNFYKHWFIYTTIK